MCSPARAIALALVVAACGRDQPERSPERAPPTSPGLSLQVTVDREESTWGPDVFGAIPHHATPATSGEARDVWSLRDLVHAQIGPTARVIAVTGAEGTKTIDAAAWSDAAQTPVLHTTRRGTLKFRFEDADGKWGQSLVSDVRAIEIAR